MAHTITDQTIFLFKFTKILINEIFKNHKTNLEDNFKFQNKNQYNNAIYICYFLVAIKMCQTHVSLMRGLEDQTNAIKQVSPLMKAKMKATTLLTINKALEMSLNKFFH